MLCVAVFDFVEQMLQLHLKVNRQFRHLVKIDGARRVRSARKKAPPHRVRTEQTACNLHERAIPRGAVLVNGTSEQVLSCPRFAGDQYRRSPARYAGGGVEDLEKPGRVPHDIPESRKLIQLSSNTVHAVEQNPSPD